MAQLKVTYKKSKIGYAHDQKRTIASLGLRRLNQSVLLPDNPAVRGMIFKVRHLVVVEEVENGAETSVGAATPQVQARAATTATPQVATAPQTSTTPEAAAPRRRVRVYGGEDAR